MKISEKLFMDFQGLVENGPINIVAFGDSVTHGAVGPDEIDYETVYWNRLRQMLNRRRNFVPVNVINAGIGGITAKGSLARMDAQVLDHHPDLVIVCFGLNDVNGTLEEYLESLQEIFSRCAAAGVDTIFMTPNMLNTYVAENTEAQFFEYAGVTAQMQNSGKMDQFMSSACALAREMGVTVCDCYAEWKKLAQTQDTTQLLANRINHPTREMHTLFADMLYRIILPEEAGSAEADSNTMYKQQ